ncbi:hypothetical protein NA57DRAFT_72911 [Rhizodiscina lignyota]|uniref:Mtf2-like C-terminal domain-containing protein n=1 Tax=Rhizodiscina lignyota TaxID=1504668 RepID=A0A9P4ILH6_9PEZI|nr:hypothetical protein NA57DRAFT_72911 [Rhizodiscina lignyota]
MRRSLVSWSTGFSRRATTFPPSTLLPFLYQTKTIQSSGVTLQNIRRHRSTRHTDGETNSRATHIPFDNVTETTPEASTGGAGGPEKTTLSAAEQEAFAKLFDKLASNQIRKPSIALKTPSQEASKGTQPLISKLRQRDAVLARLPSSLKSIAEAAGARIEDVQSEQEQGIHSTTGDAATTDHDENAWPHTQESEPELDRQAKEHIRNIEALIEEQDTDMKVWDILQTKVFEPLHALNLDLPSHAKEAKPNAKTRGRPKGTQPQISPELLTATLPQIIAFALDHFHTKYPASPLSTTLLPHLKQVSRTAHLLSLTPGLYASLLRITWARTTSPHRIVSILQEVETEGVELDRSVLASLTTILAEAEDMRTGKWGKVVQMVSGFEGWADQVEVLKEGWRPLIHQRIVDAAFREVREQEANSEASGSSGEEISGDTTSIRHSGH